MRIQISPTDGVPIYMQIVQQVRRLIALGELSEGEDLPSIRVLAEQLVVNPNTVARAYRELEALGVVAFSRGLGTFVASTDPEMTKEERREMLVEKIDALLLEARRMRTPLKEVLSLVHARDAALSAGDETEVVRG